MASQAGSWEVNLGGEWKPLGPEESRFLSVLQAHGRDSAELSVRGQTYRFDVGQMEQVNTASGKTRPIRCRGAAAGGASVAGAGAAASSASSAAPALPSLPTASPPALSTASANQSGSPSASPGASPAASPAYQRKPPLRSLVAGVTGRIPSTRVIAPGAKVVEVWLAGEWKKLGPPESQEIARQQAAGNLVFDVKARDTRYRIDLTQMTQTNLQSKRTRTIRIVDETVARQPGVGFDQFREAFAQAFQAEGQLSAASGKAPKTVTERGLLLSWPPLPPKRQELAHETAKAALHAMDLRAHGKADMVEWIHYWALERDSPSYHAGQEVNEKLAKALRTDQQVLGRMQMHFETALGESGGAAGTLSAEGLRRVCRRLVDSPQNCLEKQWAQEVLQKEKDGEVMEEDVELTYYDFLNIMLGRKKFKVSLWMYDISGGVARNVSWVLLGHHFEGIWHTAIVAEWPEEASEFWFGGSLFESKPGTTPFEQPVEKRHLGYTYKLREEVWNHCRRHLASEFTRANYDVLTHNCNHFSDALWMFLSNEHIPDEVLRQPEIAMNSLIAQILRPALNHWLGGFGDKDGRATDGGEEARKVWETVEPGCLIEFCQEELGRPFVGEVKRKRAEDCLVVNLDLYGEQVERLVPQGLVMKVTKSSPAGYVREPSDLDERAGRPRVGSAVLPERAMCLWFCGGPCFRG